MNLRRQRCTYAFLLATCGSTALSACSKENVEVVEDTVGAIDLALSAGGTELTSLTYKITGNGFTKDGSIPVAASGNTFSALIGGLPAGQGFTITLNATDASGELMCIGSAMFNVTAGQTSSVSVRLQCPGARKTGSVMVNGEINVCAVAEGASSSLSRIPVGASADLTGLGSDEDSGPGPLSYQWSLTSGPGTLASANQANAKLTCDAAGTVTVKLAVTDGDCGSDAEIEVVCQSGGGAAGSGAAGSGSAGSGGTGEAGSGGSGEAGSGGTGEAGSGGTGEAGSGGTGEAGSGGTGEAGSGGGGCTEGAATPVTINFRGVFNGQDFACGQNYTAGTGSTTVTATDFRMFVQDLKLVRSDGVEVAVTLDINAWQSAQVALVDFEDGSGNCFEGNPERNTVITGTVPSSSCQYTGVKFANGIPAAINHANPASATPPLSTYPTLSWGWLTGFRFTKFEVTQTNPSGDFPGVGVLHSGSTACTGSPQQGTVNCSKPNRNAISLSGFAPDSGTILVDLGKAFAGTDLTADSQCHSSDPAVCTPMFDALGVNYATGQPKSGQTIFSVE